MKIDPTGTIFEPGIASIRRANHSLVYSSDATCMVRVARPCGGDTNYSGIRSHLLLPPQPWCSAVVPTSSLPYATFSKRKIRCGPQSHVL